MTTATTRKTHNKGSNNKVEMVGHYGSDLTHALSAWTSTTRDLDIPDKNGVTKRQRVDVVLSTLASNHHETPFEKSSLHFLVTTEIATHIQLLKHRIGVSLNGESARYKELKDDKYYVPQDWSKEEQERYISFMENALKEYHETMARLVKAGMSKTRAKESARFYLPYGNQITADVMFNFRSFVHFLRLRYSTHAQAEIRQLAGEMLQQVIDLPGKPFKLTLEAFGLVDEHGNKVPPFED